MRTILKGHVSPETAYVVDDYPYGYTLRCKIRYWLEYNPKRGFRFISQTTNPKRPGEVWNKPKASTYCRFGGAMFLDEEKGHVHWTGLSEYSDAAEATAFQATYGEGVPEAGRDTLNKWVAAKTVYEANRNPGDPLHVGFVQARAALHGLTYKFVETDNGNCRVYYKNGEKLRCFQQDRPGEFTFYACSSDGEPECEAKPAMELDRLPDDDSATSRAFREWKAKA